MGEMRVSYKIKRGRTSEVHINGGDGVWGGGLQKNKLYIYRYYFEVSAALYSEMSGRTEKFLSEKRTVCRGKESWVFILALSQNLG